MKSASDAEIPLPRKNRGSRINTGVVTTVYNVVIFNITLGINGSEEFDLHGLFSHELATIPTSLFLDDGSMISVSSKSKPNNDLEDPSRTGEIPDWIVLDGCAILLTINCSIYGTLLKWVNVVTAYVHSRVVNCDVHLSSTDKWAIA